MDYTDIKCKLDDVLQDHLQLESVITDPEEFEWCQLYLKLKDEYYKTGKISFEDVSLSRDDIYNSLKEIYRCKNTEELIYNDLLLCEDLLWCFAGLDYDNIKNEVFCVDPEFYEYDLARYDFLEHLLHGFWDKIDKWWCISHTMKLLREGLEEYYINQGKSLDTAKQLLLTNNGKGFNHFSFHCGIDTVGIEKNYEICHKDDIKRWNINYEVLVNNAISYFKEYIDSFKEKDFPLILSSKYIAEMIDRELKKREDDIDTINESFGKAFNSKDEKIIYEKLCKLYDKDDIVREYKSKIYPWHCDYYIKSKQLFIEYQGTWTHGKAPWDFSLNQKIKALSMYNKGKENNKNIFFQAIKNWTITDSVKRLWAKKHNLNWIEFFDMNEIDNWINNQLDK